MQSNMAFFFYIHGAEYPYSMLLYQPVVAVQGKLVSSIVLSEPKQCVQLRALHYYSTQLHYEARYISLFQETIKLRLSEPLNILHTSQEMPSQ